MVYSLHMLSMLIWPLFNGIYSGRIRPPPPPPGDGINKAFSDKSTVGSFLDHISLESHLMYLQHTIK